MKTVFSRKDNGAEWFWHTKADNGQIVADGSEGYNNLNDSIHGFLVSQGVSSVGIDEGVIAEFHSKLVRHDEVHDGRPTLTYHFTHE